MEESEDTARPAFSAGFPNAAADAADVPLDLNRLVVSHPASTFYMRMGSNTWENLGVNQGDILVIDRSSTPKANDLAVITDGDEFGLIRVPVKPLAGLEDVQVWGVVTWVIQQRKQGGK